MAPIAKPKIQLQKTFLREWRRRSNFSQESAAKELQISRPLLSQIENAKSPYTQRLIENAAVLYQCTPAEILGGPGVINFQVLEDSVKAVDEIHQQRETSLTSGERAHLIVTYYRDSMKLVSIKSSIT